MIKNCLSNILNSKKVRIILNHIDLIKMQKREYLKILFSLLKHSTHTFFVRSIEALLKSDAALITDLNSSYLCKSNTLVL